MTQRIASRPRGWLAALVALGAALAASPLLATSAAAAPGDPFDAASPAVYVSQSNPATGQTQLRAAVTDGAGVTSFVDVGAPTNFTYNALAFNTADNYLYAIAGGTGTDSNGAAVAVGSLVRIGQDGHVTRVGTGAPGGGALNVGSFGADGNLYVMNGNNGTEMRVINPSTGALVRSVPLTATPAISDMVYKDGYFWGTQNFTGRIVRIDPTSGQVSAFGALLPANESQGAVWLYGNGNLGVMTNTSGTIYQIEITNAGSAAPSFRIIATSDGPAADNNDGASSPGIPTDLGISKDGPETYVPGGTIEYTLTVTNNGAGVSSGFTVTDDVPAPLVGVQAGEGCTVDGRNVTCVSGTLAVGESREFTITATVPEGATGPIANTATVLPNEEDSDPSNNTDETVAEPAEECLPADSTLVDDSASVVTGSSVTIDVTGNDTIPEGKQVETVADAEHGTVTQNTDGTFTYVPESGFTGTDTFTYTVSGPYCEPLVATVTITVTEDPEPPVPMTSTAGAVLALAGAVLGLRRRTKI